MYHFQCYNTLLFQYSEPTLGFAYTCEDSNFSLGQILFSSSYTKLGIRQASFKVLIELCAIAFHVLNGMLRYPFWPCSLIV